jgi:hypothetical protein
MILWHLGFTPLVVWSVFRDPRMDFRFLLIGSLLPDVVDAAVLDPAWGHSLVVNAGALGAALLIGRGRRAVRRALVALVIGSLLHLFLDATWTDRDVFWWPSFGLDVPPGRIWPRGWHLIGEELAGLVALAWFVGRFSLGEPTRRRQFLRTGTLVPPETTGPAEPTGSTDDAAGGTGRAGPRSVDDGGRGDDR